MQGAAQEAKQDAVEGEAFPVGVDTDHTDTAHHDVVEAVEEAAEQEDPVETLVAPDQEIGVNTE